MPWCNHHPQSPYFGHKNSVEVPLTLWCHCGLITTCRDEVIRPHYSHQLYRGEQMPVVEGPDSSSLNPWSQGPVWAGQCRQVPSDSAYTFSLYSEEYRVHTECSVLSPISAHSYQSSVLSVLSPISPQSYQSSPTEMDHLSLAANVFLYSNEFPSKEYCSGQKSI